MRGIGKFFAGLLFVLTGCSGITTRDYAQEKPVLDIRQYLNGNLQAWGVLFDYTGKADLHFHVTMKGRWNGNVGTLEEHFVYSDGRKESRTWTITFHDDQHFTATAGDVVGEAKGSQHGNAANMQYVLNATRASGEKIQLTLDDWLYLVDDKTLMNRTKIRKFGITVSELMIAFRKE